MAAGVKKEIELEIALVLFRTRPKRRASRNVTEMFLFSEMKAAKIDTMGSRHFGWIVVVIDLALVSIAARDVLGFTTCFTKGSRLRNQTATN
jgi:hypothetical protein